jgi:hypothetical protein
MNNEDNVFSWNPNPNPDDGSRKKNFHIRQEGSVKTRSCSTFVMSIQRLVRYIHLTGTRYRNDINDQYRTCIDTFQEHENKRAIFQYHYIINDETTHHTYENNIIHHHHGTRTHSIHCAGAASKENTEEKKGFDFF